MNWSVEFDNQPMSEATEIGDILTDRNLPAEVRTGTGEIAADVLP